MKNILIVITVLILLGVGGYFTYNYWFNNFNKDPQVLFEKYFNPNPNYWTQGEKENMDSLNWLKYAAMNNYTKKDYQLAIDAFHKFEPEKADEGYYNFYLALCYIKTDFNGLAVNHLVIATESFTDFTEIYMAKWYLALAYLKNERTNECLRELNEIIKMNSSYKALAQQLKTDLGEQ